MAFLELMPEAPRRALERMAEALHLPAGERLIRAGERGGDLFRLVSGSLEVVDPHARPELILDVLGPGAVVGELGFLSEVPRSADVRAFEDCHLLRWPEARLRGALDEEPALAAAFYRAVALTLAGRIRSGNAALAAPEEALAEDAVRGAGQVVEALKSSLLRLEGPLRAGEAGATRALDRAWSSFLARGERLLASLNQRERARCGALMRRELSPYLRRARTAELCLADRVGGWAALAHIEDGSPRGGDALGRALDAALLASPTACALRARRRLMAEVAAEARTEAPARVAVVGCGSGGLPGTLGLLLGSGSELLCVDGDREALARLHGATVARDPGLALRLVQEDLGALALGSSTLYLPEQDLILVHGLLEFMPAALVPGLLARLRERLRPGGALLVDTLDAQGDAFLFEHVLGWPLLRRDAPPGVSAQRVAEGEGASVWRIDAYAE